MDVPIEEQPFGPNNLEHHFPESETLARLLVEGTPEYAIFILDLQGIVLNWNSGAERIKGYQPDEIIGQHFSVFYTAKDRAGGHPERELAIAAREGRYAEEGWRLRQNGELFWASVVITALRDRKGQLAGYGKLTRDLTERKVAEEALAASTATLTRLVQGSRDAFILRENQVGGRLLFANAAAGAMLGVAPEALGRALPATGPLAIGGEIDRWVLTSTVHDAEREFTHIDAASDSVSLRVRRVPLPSTVPPQCALFIEDVTERHNVEFELHEVSERFAQLVQSLTDAYVIFDIAASRTLYASPSCLDVLGFPAEEFLADNDRLTKAVLPEDLAHALKTLDQEREAWGRSMTTGTDVEFRVRHPQGDVRWIRARYSPIALDEKTPSRVSAVYEDITERKETEDALQAARQSAEEASGAKNEFLSRMSHELRTPMNAVLGFAQLLQLDDLTPSQSEAVSHILRSGDHLLNLINEVLDMARIESGQLDITPVAVHVRELINEVVDLMGPIAVRSDVTLNVLPSDDLWALADAQLVRQVLLNLLSNGIKYNVAGGSVSVGVMGDREQLRISVTDTGIGIEEADLARLFQPFDRLGQVGSSVEGTGVGLAISRKLVEALQGTLTVESAVSSGTTFSVTLPGAATGTDEAPSPASRRPPLEPPTDGRRLRVLYIEDNPSNYRLVERIVENRPAWAVAGAVSGSLGVELAREINPDLVLLDLHLPDMSGLDVLAAFRSHSETALTPVVVLSADATPGQISKLRAEGILDYLTKPLSVPALLGILDSVSVGPHEGP